MISTERKKLTIFFSDIKDFTETAEHLQPEELTALLNEYFTEMSAIAHAHGATVDQVHRRCDPRLLRGPRNAGGAGGCQRLPRHGNGHAAAHGRAQARVAAAGNREALRGAHGHQHRLLQRGEFRFVRPDGLHDHRRRGEPGGRLQGIAEPGGIVISYETWAHVQERVRVHQLPPITLKGISGEIVPYAVDGLAGDDAGEGGEATILREEGEGLHLRLDLDRLDGDARRRARAALEKALEALRRGEGESASS